LLFDELTNGQAVMHYSRHRLTALVACATIVLYTVADDHYVRPACLLVGVSETKPFLVQFGYIFLYTPLCILSVTPHGWCCFAGGTQL